MSDADGIALTSVAHPKAAWYKRLRFWLCPPRLSPDSLETIEIEIREPAQGQRILNSILSPTRVAVPHGLRVKSYDAATETYILERVVDDKSVEQEIQAKGLTAPRVTLADIEACIAREYYFDAEQGVTRALLDGDHGMTSLDVHDSLSLLTFCVLVLKNGFTVTGESACASPENFDEALGRSIARQKAIDKVWMLEGYALKQRLYADAVNRSSGGGDFGDS